MAELTVNEKVNTSGQPLKYGSQLVIEMEKLQGISTNSLYIREGHMNKTLFLTRRGNGTGGKGDISAIHVEGKIDVNKVLFNQIKSYAEKANAVVSFKEEPKKSNSISF